MSEKSEVAGPTASGEEYEALRQRHIARLESLLPEYRDRIEWSREQLRTETDRALRELLSAAMERSPWHRERLAGIDFHGFSEADIGSLPVMTKTDLMDNFDDIVTDRRLSRELCERHLDEMTGPRYLLGEYHVVASGGSSGLRGVFVYGWDAWATCFASILRFQQRDWASDPALVGVPRVTAVVAASQATHISSALRQTFSNPRSPQYLFPVTEPLERIVQGLNELQPTVLMGYSSFLPRLALESRDGRLRISPRRVITISEPLLPEARAALDETWGVPIANAYGMSEGLFSGCCREAMHLPDDLCLVEPVDDAGRPVPPGSPSRRVLVTNLYNHTLPLIRFEVTDEVTVLDGACPCGSALSRINDPQGRLDDIFVYPGGVSIHPHVFRSALGQYPQIVEYQVCQTVRGADIRVLAQSQSDALHVDRKIEQALAALGLDQPEVTVTRVDALDRQTSGKLKRFVPLGG